ncbi:MAG: hypothetical protein QG604_202 [Candidatus Dependentiae bacterium]|nr:hypothetical protein [Candidatus Dependentiae bacterium]
MSHKGRPMAKRQFRIGELATALSVEKYVIRFWEKEFCFTGYRSEGGQRFYTNDDLSTFMYIKELLYKKGFTIAGARQQLEQRQKNRIKEVAAVPAHIVSPARSLSPSQCPSCKHTETLQRELEQLAHKLHNLQKQLTPQSRS